MSTLGLINLNARYQKINRGEEVNCSVHGLHKHWTTFRNKSSRCDLCANERAILWRKNNPIKSLLRDAKYHSKKTKREFSICEQDVINLLEKQNNKCAISGLYFSEYKPSLDRIDSSKGYTQDNIQLVTFQVNRMKSDFEITDFINVCKQIAKFNGDK